jgi:hypothetical protein
VQALRCSGVPSAQAEPFANRVRKSPTVEALRARLLAAAKRMNLGFMTASPLLASPALASVADRLTRNIFGKM